MSVERTSDEILGARARQLAALDAVSSTGSEMQVLCFRLGTEHYAVELRLLRAVHHASGLTPIPCTPPFIAGALNVRGEVITVVALDVVLGLSTEQHGRRNLTEATRVLLVDYQQLQTGLLVDEVLGIEWLAHHTLEQGLSGRGFIKGIADARMVLVDLEELLAGGRFDVDESVS